MTEVAAAIQAKGLVSCIFDRCTVGDVAHPHGRKTTELMVSPSVAPEAAAKIGVNLCPRTGDHENHASPSGADLAAMARLPGRMLTLLAQLFLSNPGKPRDRAPSRAGKPVDRTAAADRPRRAQTDVRYDDNGKAHFDAGNANTVSCLCSTRLTLRSML